MAYPGDKGPSAMLEERIADYEAAIRDTRRFLEIAREAGADD